MEPRKSGTRGGRDDGAGFLLQGRGGGWGWFVLWVGGVERARIIPSSKTRNISINLAQSRYRDGVEREGQKSRPGVP